MSKLIAVLNVVAWAGFWSFGYLALTTPPEEGSRVVVALLLAALGAALGIWAWFWIVRHSEGTGYARRSNSRARFDADEGLDA
ncbi:hypothetical protein [Sagittula salina]|uniref:Uncharacterized protein n=1 Tax=Sagittula salina TaxID=2820268 RepID=A0A940MLL0_9RHOB|nr:hypothetical protein [Sagittula salina]MBP0481599.1 hypothetical protein [Sagittula salina]